MAIPWNRVTWYTKAIALLLFIALPIVSFFLGRNYGLAIAPTDQLLTAQSLAKTGTTAPNTPISGTQLTYENAIYGFMFSYPSMYQTQSSDTTKTPAWSYFSTDPGSLAVTVAIPQSLEPGTNFGDAKFTVGEDASASALSTCLAPVVSNIATRTTQTINGITYTVIESTDAGAGNLYDISSFRTIHDAECFAMEFDIHSANIQNYGPSSGVTQFDKDKGNCYFTRNAQHAFIHKIVIWYKNVKS